MSDTPSGTVVTGRCPPWCQRSHGEVLGEDDLLHLGPSWAVGSTTVVLCTSVDPVTGKTDGPLLLVGQEELTLAHATALAEVLARAVALAGDG